MNKRNFFLLWQGQMVSALGDALYTIALNFFVLEETGSTAIMGTVMALVTIPRIICGPISGVIVDRTDRKKLIIFGDVIRGLSILFVAFAANRGILKIWIIMLVAVVSGVCSSFFNPAVESILPDIVPEQKITKAASSYQIATTGADILGQSAGGSLYGIIGASAMFLINAVSYLFSAATEVFIKIPKVQRKNLNITFWEDFKDGIRFIFKYEGLVRTIIIAFLINFLFGMNRVLIIPWFTYSEHLGMARYGILNAFQSAGLIVGMLALSVINIKQEKKYRIYIISLVVFIASIGAGAFFNQYAVILAFFFIAFGFQFVFNTMMNSTIMVKTPAEQRGKVLATKTTLCMAVSPLGNFLGGILCEFIEARRLIIINAAVAIVVVLAVLLNPKVKEFLNGEEKLSVASEYNK
ncbi:MAG: MFS transporter [Clostridiales bacterium]|nr:MFS transporter [Clostridiales bacterium]